MVSQDFNVISLLADMGNGEVQTPATDLPKVNGQNASISISNRIVHWDAEWHWDSIYTQYPHQALGGHIVALGLTNANQIWNESTDPIVSWARQQGGIAGFAHCQFLDDNFPTSLSCCTPIEYPVEVALGACDFISEDVGGSDSFIHAYYRLLNCGFRPGFAAGSDYPCGSAIGQVLTYAQVAGGQLTYSNWIHAIAAGRTMVSRNGHNEFVSLVVNGTATPGDEIQLSAAGSVPVTVTWTAQTSLTGTLELVCNGVVVASQQATAGPGSPVTLSATVDFPSSGWLCARRMAPSTGHQAHTAAVFVTVNHAPVRASVVDAEFYVQWMTNLLYNTSPGGVWNAYFPTTLATAQARYQAALGVYQQIAADALAELAVSTTSLPDGALRLAYSATLAVHGGQAPYTWAIASGSLPPGLALNAANGAITGMPTNTGTFYFGVEVSDASHPAQAAIQVFNLPIMSLPTVTIWPGTAAPGMVDAGPDSAAELGVEFKSDVAGSIAGIRFYKAAANTGTHVGNLWTSTGTLLATATFNGETASGWQQVLFSNPVSIASNTVYVASYHCEAGHYSEDDGYFASSGVDNPPLHALVDGASGPNGVYSYGASSVFPNQTWSAANYWVDVLFQVTPTASPPMVTLSPITSNVECGSNVVLTAQATGAGTLSYKWFDNQTNLLSGETGQTLKLKQVHSDNSGNYTVVVTNLDGAATNVALVSVVDTIPPAIVRTASPQTVTAGYNGLTILSNLTALIGASDACSGSVNITQQPAAGTEIPVGPTTVVFYVDDGNGNTNTCTGTVTVNAAPLVAPTILSEQVLGDGSFKLTFSGPDTQPFKVRASADLNLPLGSWDVLTNSAFGTAPATFIDTSAASQPVRFYRVGSP